MVWLLINNDAFLFRHCERTDVKELKYLRLELGGGAIWPLTNHENPRFATAYKTQSETLKFSKYNSGVHGGWTESD